MTNHINVYLLVLSYSAPWVFQFLLSTSDSIEESCMITKLSNGIVSSLSNWNAHVYVRTHIIATLRSFALLGLDMCL